MAEAKCTDGVKVCTECKLEKPVSNYRFHPGGKDGLRSKCRSCEKARNYRWVENNPEANRKIQREWRRERRSTPEGKAEQYAANKKYVEGNREKVNAYYRKRRRDCPIFKAHCAMRTALSKVMKRSNQKKTSKCEEMLGYTAAELKEHIQSQFTAGMTWDKFGSEIHLDHIVPIKWFFDNGIVDPKRINNLANLRPLWAKENMRKSAKRTHLI